VWFFSTVASNPRARVCFVDQRRPKDRPASFGILVSAATDRRLCGWVGRLRHSYWNVVQNEAVRRDRGGPLESLWNKIAEDIGLRPTKGILATTPSPMARFRLPSGRSISIQINKKREGLVDRRAGEQSKEQCAELFEGVGGFERDSG
jgi:hypothetical protein